MICGVMPNAMHGVCRGHPFNKTVVQATTCGVAIKQTHPNKELQVGSIEGDDIDVPTAKKPSMETAQQ